MAELEETWECWVTSRGTREDTGTEAQRCSESHIYWS